VRQFRSAHFCSRDFGVVDVRDLAALHIRAMTHPAAKGERFLAVAGDCMSMLAAKVLKSRMGASAKRVPSFQLPNWLVRIAAIRDAAAKQILPQLGELRNATNEKAKRMLGRAPRSNEETIVAAAESLVRRGLLKDSQKTTQKNFPSALPVQARMEERASVES
jgi:dihydroflavonol-4-reductase